jgi:hypothetical protein
MSIDGVLHVGISEGSIIKILYVSKTASYGAAPLEEVEHALAVQHSSQ